MDEHLKWISHVNLGGNKIATSIEVIKRHKATLPLILLERYIIPSFYPTLSMLL